MRLADTLTIHASIDDVWNVFMDPVKLCQALPGCEGVEQLDEKHYNASLAVRAQFMTIRTRARGTLLEAEEPHRLVVELVGEPIAMAGAFRTRLTCSFTPDKAGTRFDYTVDLVMFGRLASLGEALVRSTANRMTAQFAVQLAELFSSEDARSSEPPTGA